MNSRELSRTIAHRLPNQTQDDVSAILNTFVEIVREELMRPHGYVYLRHFGRLHIDYHVLRPGGMLKQRFRNRTLRRIYFRFVPTDELSAAVRLALMMDEDTYA